MRRLILCALVVAGCGKSTALGPKDVELTINTRATAINDEDLGTIRALELTLSGNQNDHTRYDLTRAFMRREALVVHLTKSTGELIIGALARDDQGLVVAIGNTKWTLSGTDPDVIDVDLEAPPGGTHASSAVAITPSSSLQMFGGQKAALTASSPVSWSVTGNGTVDDTGLYTAPSSAGSDEVVATSTVYFGESATVSVDVLTKGILRYAGLPASTGTLDGVGSEARVTFPRGMAPDGAGSIYFGDNSNVIRKLDIASRTVTTIAGAIENNVWADGTGAAAGFTGPWRVVWDATRKALYVADNNTVRKVVVATGAVTTLAGTNGMYESLDGTGSAAHFMSAMGLAYDGQDHLYVADNQANNIRAVDVGTAVVTTLAGIANMPGYVDGPGASAKFDYPAVLALDGQGGLFVGDSHNQLIRQIDIASKMVSTVTGKPGIAGNTDGAKGTATIGYPEAMAYDGMGSLYIGGRKIDVATGAVSTLVGPNDAWYNVTELDFASDGSLWTATSSALGTVDLGHFQLTLAAGVPLTNHDFDRVDGSRLVARFNGSTGLCAAADGTLLFRDGIGVRRVDLAADTIKSVVVFPNYIGGPQNMAVAADGNIYLAVDSNISRLLASEGYSTLHVLTGSSFGYADGTLAQAKFSCPQDLTVVGSVIYVADSCNNVIRAIDLNGGMVSTLAGTANMGGLVDMPGAAARFNFPQGITSDGNSTLYVASNNAVRKIVISGAVVSTLAGGDTNGFADGTGMAAKFNGPIRLALDPAKQNVYVSDIKNTAIRKVTLAGGVVTTVAGAVGKPIVVPGALPASINEPGALAFSPSGDLFVVVPHEESILQIRLQ